MRQKVCWSLNHWWRRSEPVGRLRMTFHQQSLSPGEQCLTLHLRTLDSHDQEGKDSCKNHQHKLKIILFTSEERKNITILESTGITAGYRKQCGYTRETQVRSTLMLQRKIQQQYIYDSSGQSKGGHKSSLGSPHAYADDKNTSILKKNITKHFIIFCEKINET